jgi:tripartite-type tricarboxylate transporter receptor subunit TctC
MVAPKSIPQEAVDRLIDALGKALDDPNTKARYIELGSTAPKPEDRGPVGAEKLVASEVARINPVLKAAMAKAAETEK